MKITSMTVVDEDGKTHTWKGEGHVLPPSQSKSREEVQKGNGTLLIQAAITMPGTV